MSCNGLQSMSLYGVCNCDTCVGGEEPLPRGAECQLCCEPVESWQEYEAERDSDGDWIFRHRTHSTGADLTQGDNHGSGEKVFGTRNPA